MKNEFKVIANLLPQNTRVLDVGCGDGSLMSLLEKEKGIEVRGLEIDQTNVQKCIHKGLSVIQGNAETELHQFPEQSFDYVVLSQTLQAFYDPSKVMDELLRIGKSVIVSIPNFGFWKVRLKLLFFGKTSSLMAPSKIKTIPGSILSSPIINSWLNMLTVRKKRKVYNVYFFIFKIYCRNLVKFLYPKLFYSFLPFLFRHKIP